MKYSEQQYPLQDESYQIIGICMEVDSELWRKLINNKKNCFIICESVAKF